MFNLYTSTNGYYIIWDIEDDKKYIYHVFCKWDWVGNSKVGSHKLEKMPKSTAILEFKQSFYENTKK
jgi:hypothetical protein